MGFWSSLGNIGLQAAGSFMPGGSTLTGLAGSLLGGLGQTGSGTANGSGTSNMSGTKTSNQTGSNNQLNETIEDPQFAEFRQALLPMMMGLMNKSQEPVYTDDKIASTLAQINNQYSKEDINPAMAGRGLLGSGFNHQMRQDVDNQRAGTASNFFTQLPFMEQQAQLTNMTNALGLGANFAGRAPVNTKLTGNTTQNSNEIFDQNGKTTTTQTTPNGSGFLSGFANSLGGFLTTLGKK